MLFTNPKLTKASNLARIFRQLKLPSLISIGKLCDYRCRATFTKEKVITTKDRKCILEGKRDPRTKLWDISLKSQNIFLSKPRQNNSHAIAPKKQCQSTHDYKEYNIIFTCSIFLPIQVNLVISYQSFLVMPHGHFSYMQRQINTSVHLL